MALPPFPAEHLLAHFPPDYETEWKSIIRQLVITAIMFILVVPVLVKNLYKSILFYNENSNNKKQNMDKGGEEYASTSFSAQRLAYSTGKDGVRVVTKTIINGVEQGKTVTTSSSSSSEKQPPSARTKKNQNQKSKGDAKEKDEAIEKRKQNNDDDDSDETQTEMEEHKLPEYIHLGVNVLFLIALFVILAFSPNNTNSARRVYLAPLLTPNECQTIIQMAERAAKINSKNAMEELSMHDLSESAGGDGKEAQNKRTKLEKILEWPAGWKKDRHASYPTTDLNVVIDFDSTDKATIRNILDARLSPLLERIYGISRDSIRANDMFVVRYDGEGQQALKEHTDSSHISFNILLNDGFEGGGTRFYDRSEQTYEDAHPKPGQVLINNAMVSHEGLATKKGTRYIFVGFMNIDPIDPWTHVKKETSYFSTYLSFPWLTVTLKEALMTRKSNEDGVNRNSNPVFSKNFYANSILTESTKRFAEWGDNFSPHGIVTMVKEEDAEVYLDTLDGFYEQNHDRLFTSRWYSGQQIMINMDGKFRSNWAERSENEELFRDEL